MTDTTIACALFALAAVIFGYGLKWVIREARDEQPDPLYTRLMDDAEWNRLVAAVEGEDFELWEHEVAS